MAFADRVCLSLRCQVFTLQRGVPADAQWTPLAEGRLIPVQIIQRKFPERQQTIGTHTFKVAQSFVLQIQVTEATVREHPFAEPGINVQRKSSCFVLWCDRRLGKALGLNFVSEYDAAEFMLAAGVTFHEQRQHVTALNGRATSQRQDQPATAPNVQITVEALDISGWLRVKHTLTRSKQSKVTLLSKRSWHKMWASLQGSMLVLADSEKAKPSSYLSIEDCLVQLAYKSNAKQHQLVLALEGGDCYHITAQEKGDLTRWARRFLLAAVVAEAKTTALRECVALVDSRIADLSELITVETNHMRTTELRLTSGVDHTSKDNLSAQIAHWQVHLEQLHVTLFRYECYRSVLVHYHEWSMEHLPPAQRLLGCLSRQTRDKLNKLGYLNATGLYAVVAARTERETLQQLSHARKLLMDDAQPKRGKKSKDDTKATAAATPETQAMRRLNLLGQFVRVYVEGQGHTVLKWRDNMTAQDVLLETCSNRNASFRDFYLVASVREQHRGGGACTRRLQPAAAIDDRMSNFRLIRKAQRHVVVQRTLGESFGLILDVLQTQQGDTSVDEVVVEHVLPNSPASVAGIAPGDCLLELSGQRLTGTNVGYVEQLMLKAQRLELLVRHEGTRPAQVADDVYQDVTAFVAQNTLAPPPRLSGQRRRRRRRRYSDDDDDDDDEDEDEVTESMVPSPPCVCEVWAGDPLAHRLGNIRDGVCPLCGRWSAQGADTLPPNGDSRLGTGDAKQLGKGQANGSLSDRGEGEELTNDHAHQRHEEPMGRKRTSQGAAVKGTRNNDKVGEDERSSSSSSNNGNISVSTGGGDGGGESVKGGSNKKSGKGKGGSTRSRVLVDHPTKQVRPSSFKFAAHQPLDDRDPHTFARQVSYFIRDTDAVTRYMQQLLKHRTPLDDMDFGGIEEEAEEQDKGKGAGGENAKPDHGGLATAAAAAAAASRGMNGSGPATGGGSGGRGERATAYSTASGGADTESDDLFSSVSSSSTAASDARGRQRQQQKQQQQQQQQQQQHAHPSSSSSSSVTPHPSYTAPTTPTLPSSSAASAGQREIAAVRQQSTPALLLSPDMMSPLAAKKAKELLRLRATIQELVETERSYVESLDMLLQRFIRPLIAHRMLAAEDQAIVVSNLPELVAFQHGFLQQLESICRVVLASHSAQVSPGDARALTRAAEAVARLFVAKAAGFRIYARYCATHAAAVKVVSNEEDEQLQAWLDARNPRQEQSAKLSSLLIKPVQRVLKYPLLMKEVGSHIAGAGAVKAAVQAAVDALSSLAAHINDMTRLCETFAEPLAQALPTFDLSKNLDALQTSEDVMWVNALDDRNKPHRHVPCQLLVFTHALLLFEQLPSAEKGNKRKGPSSITPLPRFVFVAHIPVTRASVVSGLDKRVPAVGPNANAVSWTLYHLQPHEHEQKQQQQQQQQHQQQEQQRLGQSQSSIVQQQQQQQEQQSGGGGSTSGSDRAGGPEDGQDGRSAGNRSPRLLRRPSLSGVKRSKRAVLASACMSVVDDATGRKQHVYCFSMEHDAAKTAMVKRLTELILQSAR